MQTRSVRIPVCAGILSMVMAIPCLKAQSYVRSGSFEVGPFVGASYGIDKFRPIGGGNVTFAIDKYILPYFEYSYFPGIPRNISGVIPGTGTPFTQSTAIPLSDIHGGVHIRLPIFHESPVVPYLVFGIGGLRHSARTINVNYTSFGLPETLQIMDPAGTDRAENFGGGIRYYVSQRFGMRVEAKAYKPSGEFTQTFGKVEFGFFFQLR